MPSSDRYENVALWGVLILIVSAFTAKKVVQIMDEAKITFKKNIAPVAMDEEARSGIKPVITITQAAHESNWGRSLLTQQANNLFGFTGDSWEKAGKPVLKMPTKEFLNNAWVTVNRPFRAYKSWAESVRDWGTLISTQSRYAKAYEKAKQGDVAGFAVEIARAGYATDPHYASSLVRVFNTVQSIPEATA